MTTVVVDFEESDILKRIKRINDGVEVECICLSLGKNPSEYDSYLFRTSAIELIKE